MVAAVKRWAAGMAILVGAQGLGQGCSYFEDVKKNKPLGYAGELAYCETHSTSWGEYIPCCVDVARRYGRDPGFCFPDSEKDAGAAGASHD